jgi:rhodanese-related sulfurtransferase
MLTLLFVICRSLLFPDGFNYLNEPFERIPSDRLATILTKSPSPDSQWQTSLVIDARSDLEYTGGHIHGAINCHDEYSDVARLYVNHYRPNILFIFHGEHSHHRGPTAARLFIDIHQKSQYSSQPLFVVVLDQGFSEFYSRHTALCDSEYWPFAFVKYRNEIAKDES